MRESPPFYYLFCNHWTQGGIGFAFPAGWYGGRRYDRTFSSVYTISKMLDAADRYPGLIVALELDAYAYEEIAKEDPSCIERLKQYIAEGKAAVEGGTYGQPFGQDYGWEPNIRQLTYGRETIRRLLQTDTRAFLVEEQWFHPQMPQLLMKSGFHYASLQNQNSGQVKPMNTEMIQWRGLDGTTIPAIPANDLQVSCVRQYTDYSSFEERLAAYNRPLLFQWVEIWSPGMDWGASAVPFDKAIKQVLSLGGQPTGLTSYFERELQGRELQEYYITLDESHYANNWYQGGGWGYDGDRVIMWDKRAERALLSYESFAAIHHVLGQTPYPEHELTDLWKRLLILQNHDFSVARSYRAYTPDGLETNAGSLGVTEYKRLVDFCTASLQGDTSNEEPSIIMWNPSPYSHRKWVTLPWIKNEDAPIGVTANGKPIPVQWVNNHKGVGQAIVSLAFDGYETVELERAESDTSSKKPSTRWGKDWVEDDRFRLSWIPGSWAVEIWDKADNTRMTFKGFTGPIGKVNEHDGQLYHALSSAHEQFTFAFDGTTHAPDQIARISACVEETGPLRSTLLVRSDLLTLHTTETPVAFAEARVSIDHAAGNIHCSSYLYTGVYLSVQCWADWDHAWSGASYFRDFPFGEEETFMDEIYSNTYTRVQAGDSGFTLVHPGLQRVQLRRRSDGGTVRHLLARDKILGDYSWSFVLHKGRHQPWESAVYSQTDMTPAYRVPVRLPGGMIQTSNPCILVSAFYKEGDKHRLRLINYSPDPHPSVSISLSVPFRRCVQTDFTGNAEVEVTSVHSLDDTVICLSFTPWEIVTLALG